MFAGCGDRRRAVEQQARAEASSPAFDVFHVGAVFEDLTMSEAVREHAGGGPLFPELGRQDTVTYLYGECPRLHGAAAGIEGGCLPPLEVQTTPLCEKHARLYRDRTYRATKTKAVPAASFDGGRILEIYTANTTITIYGERPELVLRAAAGLRRAAPINIPSGVQPLHALTAGLEPVSPRTLPPPDPVALAQTKPCR